MNQRPFQAGHGEALYRTLVETLPLVTYVITVDETGANEQTVYTSPQLEPLTGFKALVSRAEWLAQIHPEDRSRVQASLEQHNALLREGVPDDHWQADYRLLAKDGRVLWIHDEAIIVRDESGVPRLIQGFMLDLTARREAEEALRQTEALAATDDLTGLANRRAFVAAVEREIARSARYGRPLVLLLWDLNDFKALNDRQGHLAGDAALRAFANAVRSSIRSTDLVARIGGDEFAAVLPESAMPGARALHERVEQLLGSAPAGKGLTVAVGAAAFPADGATFDELFAAADGRMYKDKARRGNS